MIKEEEDDSDNSDVDFDSDDLGDELANEEE